MLSPPAPFLAEIGRTQKVHAKSPPPPFFSRKKVKGGRGLSMKLTVGKKQYPHTYYLSTYLIKSLLDSFFVKGETRLKFCFPIDFWTDLLKKNEGGFFLRKSREKHFVNFKRFFFLYSRQVTVIKPQ